MTINTVELATRTQLFSEQVGGSRSIMLPNQKEIESALNGLVEAGVHPKLIGATAFAAGGAMLGLTCSRLISPEESPTDAVIAGALIGGGLGFLIL